MAHWISSKLKVAESFLQQIDQQAAESLGKNENPRSDELGFETSPRITGTKPLKDQLKKKLPQTDVHIGKPQSNRNLSLVNSNYITSSGGSSSSSISNDDGRDKEVGASVNLSPKPSGGDLKDSDWTKLLSAPSKKAVSSVVRSSNGVPVVRGVKKDGKRQGVLGSGPRTNLSVLDGKRSQQSKDGALTNLRKSGNHLGSKVNGGGADGKVSDRAEITPRTSSVDLHSDAESVERSDLDRDGKGVNNDNGGKEEGSKGNNEKMDSNSNMELLNPKDDSADKNGSLLMASAILEGSLDLNKGIKGEERFSSLEKGVTSFAPGSRSSTSTKRGSSSASDEDSDSDSDSSSSSDSEREREQEERRKRRQKMLAEKAAAKALEAIKERENTVAKLEGEKQSLEKILDKRARQQVQEASELQSAMMEVLEAVDLEKQKHNNTRMEALARLAKLEAANADLAKSLANAQWNLEVEVNRVAELRQQIELKAAAHEGLRRKLSSTYQSGDKFVASKGYELEREMLQAEYSFLTDKVEQLQDKVRTLEASIESTRRELWSPTKVEVDLKRRLGQLTDHLIQKQAQVETLSSEKATLAFKIESVSRLLNESKASTNSADFPSTSSRDLESGLLQLPSSKLKPLLESRIRSGQQQLGSLVRQLDSIFCAASVFLKRNSAARIWSLVYLLCLHLWVVYILSSHSSVSDEDKSGAVFSLQNINNTGGV